MVEILGPSTGSQTRNRRETTHKTSKIQQMVWTLPEARWRVVIQGRCGRLLVGPRPTSPPFGYTPVGRLFGFTGCPEAGRVQLFCMSFPFFFVIIRCSFVGPWLATAPTKFFVLATAKGLHHPPPGLTSHLGVGADSPLTARWSPPPVPPHLHKTELFVNLQALTVCVVSEGTQEQSVAEMMRSHPPKKQVNKHLL